MAESDCDCGRKGRFDPVLKIWKFSEIMLTQNDVEHGNANSTQLNVVKVVLKNGQSTNDVCVDGISVKSVLRSSTSNT